jgi:AcrR family transcriptional regulator
MDAERTAKVLEAGLQVFLRYGFKRTTMGDLAEAAGMSRPALYLVYPSKEDIFIAGLRKILDENLAEIRAGLAQRGSLREKLRFAFEVWCVKPFTMILSSPDAKDLLESTAGFAADTMRGGYADFEQVVAEILAPAVKGRGVKVSAPRMAHVLTSAMPGFKQTAGSVEQLRRMIADLLEMVLAGFGEEAPSAGSKRSRRGE